MATPPPPETSWRLILDAGERAPADGPTNMAVDHALLASVAAGAAPVLRLYRWSPATVSFGRNQPARGLYDEGAAADRGIAFVRRPTGGQAVLHDDELTYAVVAPIAVLGRPRAAYRRINEALVVALRGLGVGAAVAGAGGSGESDPRPAEPPARAGAGRWMEACFRRPERGEVVVGGRKLVGSAQRAESRTILQHGSILLGGSQAAAEELLVGCRGSVAPGGVDGPSRVAGSLGSPGSPGWTTVAAELGRRLPAEALESAVIAGFGGVLGISLARTGLVSKETAAARELRGRYASADWTWRR